MDELRGKRVLVTGAGGFIGANLVRALLDEGARVVGTIRPGSSPWRLAELEGDLELVEVEIRSPEGFVARLCPELAVGCAAVRGHPQTAAERFAQLEVSVLGTARLVEALAGAGCTGLVHLGTSLEYGPKDGPIREDDSLTPTVPRGAAKAAETLVCLTLARTLGLRALVLRPFSVYGPWQGATRLVPVALRAALDGTELPLVEAGIVRDFVYVGDVVDAILLALGGAEELDGAVVNVGSGVQTTVEELVAAAGRVAGREVRVLPGSFPTRPFDTGSWVADVTLADALLGWRPTTSLEDGLRLTAAWLYPRL